MSFVVIAHNIRSVYNVGSIFRTCEGLGAEKLYLTGYTPYPSKGANDDRLPHISLKLTAQIHKTALGAENFVDFEHSNDPVQLISKLKTDGYKIIALEQHPDSIPINELPGRLTKTALILGEEVSGIPDEVIRKSDMIAEIPMRGKKESFNVSVAAGIAMYCISVKD